MFLKPFSNWRAFCHYHQTNTLVTAEGVEICRVIGEISIVRGGVQGAGGGVQGGGVVHMSGGRGEGYRGAGWYICQGHGR